MPEISEGQFVILFDGYCNLCNGAVRFVIERDRREVFHFAALSWPIGEALKNRFSELKAVDSIVLYDGEKVHVKSNAALKIAGKLGALWPLFGVFWIVPRPLRDTVYSWIAHNRYRWFGKKETCMMPTPEREKRFLKD
jgi:predicted DCC family thiol-disulfide oxidoreductase YuxK